MNREERTLLTHETNVELLHLFTQQNCLEHLVLWRIAVIWHLLTQRMLRAGKNLSIHFLLVLLLRKQTSREVD